MVAIFYNLVKNKTYQLMQLVYAKYYLS